jgi:hypothetical protein
MRTEIDNTHVSEPESIAPEDRPLLQRPLAALHDAEGEQLPANMPSVVDAHVHLFPTKLFQAVWDWFDQHGWPIRYRFSAPEILEFLIGRGVDHVVGLQYAHKPGMADELNTLMAGWMAEFPQLVGLATCFPGEKDATGILSRAFENGLKGVKLHVHVQGFDMNAPQLGDIYRTCVEHNRPLLMHAGREPKSPAYRHDPYALCSADRVTNILQEFPDLRLCVPHMGMGEYAAYARLIERYDNLWLDTTMALADYFTEVQAPDIREMRLDRIMYGSDFPNIPYAWDREVKCIQGIGLKPADLARIMGDNAHEFYGIE